MKATNIQALDARQHLGELLELAHYKNHLFRISRKNKAMGWLVGIEFMQAISGLLEHIIEHHPALADTLTLSLDDHIRAVIEEGTKEVKEGKRLPIGVILEDK
jgi:hypothetical protein